MKIVVLFHRLGPYHHARLRAAGEKCELTAIELSNVDKTYAWAKVSGAVNFSRITIFHDIDVENKSPVDIRRELWSVLDKCAPQIVTIPGWGTPAALCAIEWCLLKRVPAVVMSDSQFIDEPRIWWKEWIKTRIVRQFCAGLVAGVRHVEYIATLGMPPKLIYTGYDVVENEHFSQGAVMSRSQINELRARKRLPENFFLNSSRFVEKKNLSGLINAYARYQKAIGAAAWHLVIIGDGHLRAEIEEQISRLGLQSWVHLPGFKQYDELPEYYGLAGAYVQASTTEQWGLVVNEAMASGLPVLVSERCGCAPDLVQPGINGYTFDPYNIEELAGLLRKLADSECDLAAMGQASRGIISHWTPATFAENLFKAACKAMEVLPPKFSWLDRLLLKCLTRR